MGFLNKNIKHKFIMYVERDRERKVRVALVHYLHVRRFETVISTFALHDLSPPRILLRP